MYAVSVTFYEKMSNHLIDSTKKCLQEMVSAYIPPFPTAHNNELFYTKSVCLLSYHPFVNSFLECLKELYRISASPGNIPIERYIYNLLHQTKLPMPSKFDVTLQWAHNKIRFHMPDLNDFPLLDVDMAKVFAFLGKHTHTRLLLCFFFIFLCKFNLLLFFPFFLFFVEIHMRSMNL